MSHIIKQVLLLSLILSASSMCLRAQRNYFDYYLNKDYQRGMQWILDNYDSNDVKLNYWLGELGMLSKNWKESWRGYVQVAAKLAIKPCNAKTMTSQEYEACVKNNEYYWKSLDGLGVVSARLGKASKSLSYLLEADEWNKYARIDNDLITTHNYNLACAWALNGEAEFATKKLLEAIRSKRDYLDKAKTDEDFNLIRDSRAFKNLLTNYPRMMSLWRKFQFLSSGSELKNKLRSELDGLESLCPILSKEEFEIRVRRIVGDYNLRPGDEY